MSYLSFEMINMNGVLFELIFFENIIFIDNKDGHFCLHTVATLVSKYYYFKQYLKTYNEYNTL